MLCRRRPPHAAARRGARRAATVIAAIVCALAPVSPAYADGADLGVGVGVGFGIAAPGDAWSLIDSSYSLADIDPMTGVLGAGDITTTMTDAYLTAADVSQSQLSALDTGALAEQARQQAEARRQAMLAADSRKLRPGSVPDPYGPMVEDAVARYCPQLPASVLAAQLQQESNWNPRAVSPAGAQGIAQFMPGTWASQGVDGNGDGRRDVWNPSDAIPSAAKYDCTVMNQVKDVPGDPVANMLAAYNAGPQAVRDHGGVPPFTETQNYVKTILEHAVDFAAAPGAAEGAGGCPTSAPSGTLRSGAQSTGISTLCARSVAQAPTPQAAAAIKWALNHLGIPYSQSLRNDPNWADCSSFVTRAYQQTGTAISPPGQNAPTTYSIAHARWATRVSPGQPGDLVEPEAGHVVMLLADGYVVQASHTGDVTNVTKVWWSSPYLTARVDPARV